MKRFIVLLLVFFLLSVPALAVAAAPLEQIYQIIEYHAVDPVDKTELRLRTLEEIPSFLKDPYFTYFTPQAFAYYLESHMGTFGGIGTTIQLYDKKLLIISVIPESPAAKAGLQIGDEIIAVNGINVRGISPEELAMLLRGTPGSEVSVTVLRGNEEITVSMKRAVIQIPTVRGYMQDRVAVIEITSFTANTPAEFRKVLKELRLRLPDGLIIDLRGNPGGLLTAVLEVAQELIRAGTVVRLRGRQGETIFITEETPAPLPFLVVLTDEGSASAAEILAGAVQDSGAGIVIGRKSYGKGTVQSVFLLADGGGLRLTTNRFYTPLGKPIDGVGIVPDIEVYSKEAQVDFAINIIKANTAQQATFTIGRHDVWANQYILKSDYPPFIDHNRSYLPLRLLAQSMGYYVDWDDASFTATLRREDEVIEVPLKKNVLYINGRPVYLEDPILLRANRSFVPIRAVAEALGCEVYWNNDARQVTVRW